VGAFCELRGELGAEVLHFFCKGLGVCFYIGCAYVAAGRYDIVVLADLGEARAGAKAGQVFIAAALLPSVEGLSDFLNVCCTKITQQAVFHSAELACVDKEELTAPVALLGVEVEAWAEAALEPPGGLRVR